MIEDVFEVNQNTLILKFLSTLIVIMFPNSCSESILSIDMKINRKLATVAGLECEQRRETGDQDDGMDFGRLYIVDISVFFYL